MTTQTFTPENPLWGWLRALLKLGLTLITIFLTLCFLLIFTNPRGYRSRSGGQLTACKSNCKNIATALEMYASDHKGHYPARLEDLLPGNYLRSLPTCPAAGRTTYENYQVTVKPDNFSFACCGDNHPNAGPNLPRYHSETGLIER